METLIITVATDAEAAVIKKRVRNAREIADTDKFTRTLHVDCPSEGAYQSLLKRLEAHEQNGRIDFAFGAQRA